MRMKIDPKTKSLSSIIKKYGTVTIKSSEYLEGTIRITSYKHYQFRTAVNVEFRGKVCSPRNSTWYSFKDLEKLSKIRTYRFIRRHIFKDLNLRLTVFDARISFPQQIERLKWVE